MARPAGVSASVVLASLAVVVAVSIAPAATAQSVWITGFNHDWAQHPQGYRHDINQRGQDIEVDFDFDITGVFNVDVFINGVAAGFSCDLGSNSCYGTLTQPCGKVSVKVRAFTIRHTYISNPVDVLVFNNPTCLPQPTGCELQGGGQATGKPCNVVSGRLWYETTDVQLSGPFGLRFARRYDNQSANSGDMGYGWRHAFGQELLFESGQIVYVDDEDRRSYFLGLQPGGAVHDAFSGADLSNNSAGTTFTLTTWDGRKSTFDAFGRLASMVDRTGNTQTLARDASNRIATVTDQLGRVLSFAYDASNRITAIASTPVGVSLAFTYDSPCGSGNLCSATMPDNKIWTYEYDGAHNLTRVVDPLGHAEEINTYDGSDRLATQSTDGGQNSLTFSYGTNTTTVTDGLGRQTVYTFDPNLRVVTDIQGVGCGCGGGQQRTFKYDQFLRKQWEMVGNDPNHKATWTYGRDQTAAHGGFVEIIAAYPSPTAKTELLSAGVSRTTTWGYPPLDSACRDLVSTETMPSVDTPGNTRTTTFTYSSDGKCLLLTRAEQGWVGGASTTYTTSYGYDARGRLLTVDGPRTDLSDLTTYAYYPDADADLARRGQLSTVTDAAGNVTTYAAAAAPYNTYNLFGQPLSVADPNGVVTTMAYDGWGRLTTRTLKGALGDPDLVTTNQYDDAGRLTKTTWPRSNGLSFAYDSSNRLTDTIRFGTDAKQYERTHVAYDVMSQKTEEDLDTCTTPATTCGAWSTSRKDSFTYDSFGRLLSVVHPDSTTLTNSYDAFGNLSQVKDERHTAANTLYAYDYANRLLSVTQKRTIVPGGDVVTTYAYDVHDNLTSVTDPNGNATTYAWDDFRRMKSQTSPVIGTTTYQYDPAGNLTTVTDANSAITTRTFDALNRITKAESARTGLTTEKVTWSYDSVSPTWFGRGRLREVADPNGKTTFTYDRRGLVTLQTRERAGDSTVLAYAYDVNGNRTSTTYPSGKQVTASFDFADRPISAAIPSETTFVSAATYFPGGPLRSLSLGNGVTRTMTMSQRYLPTALSVTHSTLGTLASYTYGTDSNGNITSITDGQSSAYNRSFAYDDLDRLTTANAGASLWGTGTHSYDSMGNLTAMTLGSATRTFTYAGTTSKLASVTEASPIGTRTVTYDAAGNETAVGATSYTYSPRNLLATGDGLAYRYDGRSLRTEVAAPVDRPVTVLSPASLEVGSAAQTLTVTGSNFTTSTQVSVRGTTRATTYVSSTSLQVQLQAADLATPGTYPVLAVEPGKTSNPAPLVVYFHDVGPSHWAYSFVNTLAWRGITAGCAPGLYCPTTTVSRAEMAVFLLVAEHGASYAPPACTTPVFADVPCSHWAAAWINQLAAEGITGGCGGGNYCPSNPVTRADMAVFLLATKDRGFAPPPATGTVFTDVPKTHWAAAWIEELSRRGISAGCAPGLYCPTTTVSRAEMAVFLGATWGFVAPSVDPTLRRIMHYDEDMHLVAETELTSAWQRAIAYEYVVLGDQPVAQRDLGGTPTTTWLVGDHLGTPFLQTASSGAVLWRVEAEPYGRVWALRTGSDRHQPLRFPGQEAEQLNLGLNGATERSYNIFRWYRPKWGRYSQPDPLSNFGDPHPFGYALMNPERNTDPDGRRTFGIGGSFCVDPDCRCTRAEPLKLKAEDSTDFVEVPKPGGCVDVDAVYRKKGVLKIRDFGRCRLRCSGGVPSEVVCSPLPPTTFYPCKAKLPDGWPPNELCGGGA